MKFDFKELASHTGASCASLYLNELNYHSQTHLMEEMFELSQNFVSGDGFLSGGSIPPASH